MPRHTIHPRVRRDRRRDVVPNILEQTHIFRMEYQHFGARLILVPNHRQLPIWDLYNRTRVLLDDLIHYLQDLLGRVRRPNMFRALRIIDECDAFIRNSYGVMANILNQLEHDLVVEFEANHPNDRFEDH